MPYRELRIPSSLAFLYPITILAIEVVAAQSLRLRLNDRLSWKNHRISSPLEGPLDSMKSLIRKYFDLQ